MAESSKKVIDHKTFEAELPEVLKKDLAVAVFKGTTDASGNNWCGDCVVADPHINKVLVPLCKEKDIPIYFVEVGERAEWKDPNHPLRSHKVHKVTGVPTIWLFQKGKATRKIDGDGCANDDMLTELLEDLD